MKKYETWLLGAIITAVSLWLLRAWWSSGALNLKYDWGFALFDWRHTWAGVVSAWNDQFLGEAVTVNAAWLPALLMVILGTLLGSSGLVFLQWLIVVLMVVAGVGLTRLLRQRGLPPVAALVGGLLYAAAPAVFIRIIVGFTFYLWAYALLPWLVAAWWRATTAPFDRRAWFWTPLLFALVSAQPQFFFMATLFLLVDIMALGRPRRRALTLATLSLTSAIIVQLPWLYLLLRDGAERAVTGNALGSSLANIAALPHSAVRTLFGADHHILFPVIDQLLTNRWFAAAVFTVVLLALLAPRLAWRREVKVGFILLALSWPLALGPQLPTTALFTWWYENFPFTNLFREVYHWAALTTFALALLAAWTIGWLAAHVGRRARGLLWLALLLPFYWALPFRLANFAGYLDEHTLPAGYRTLAATTPDEQQRLTRTLFLPSLGFVKFRDDRNPGAANTDVWAISTNRGQLPFQSSLLDFPTTAQALRNAALMSVYGRSTVPLIGYLQATAVNEVVVRTDLVTQYDQLFNIKDRGWQEPDFVGWLSQEPGLTPQPGAEGIERFTVNQPTAMISWAEAPALAAGDWATVAENPSAGTIYLEDLPAMPDGLPAGAGRQAADRLTWLNLPRRSAAPDLLAALLSDYDLIPRFAFAAAVRPADGWVRPNAIWWQDEWLARTRDSYLFTNGERSLRVNLDNSVGSGRRRVLAKVWRGPAAVAVTLQSGQWSATVETAANNGHWEWNDFGLVELGRDLQVNSQGESGLAQLLVVPEAVWSSTNARLAGPVEAQWQPTGAVDEIHFTKHSANRYTVTVASDQERLMVVRQGYDPGWQLRLADEVISPLPLDGYAMGFVLPAGRYDAKLIFAPQRPYVWWLTVAGGWLLALLLGGLTVGPAATASGGAKAKRWPASRRA